MAKTYSCPTCGTAFTAALIKQNSKLCPGCSTPLKHDIERVGGSIMHAWIIDDDRQAPPIAAKEKSGPKYRRISPDDDPEIFKLVGPNPGGEMDFQIVYWNKMSQTHLRCPGCDTYLHTTGVVVGWQEAFCRAKIPVGNSTGKWKKCKTRAKFIFLRRGQSHEINV